MLRKEREQDKQTIRFLQEQMVRSEVVFGLAHRAFVLLLFLVTHSQSRAEQQQLERGEQSRLSIIFFLFGKKEKANKRSLCRDQNSLLTSFCFLWEKCRDLEFNRRKKKGVAF